METSIPPNQLSDKQRLDEAASLLANAVIRLKTSPKKSEFVLDFSPTKSVHGPTNNTEKTNGKLSYR